MKRRDWLAIFGALAFTTPLLAQEPYSPSTSGYSPESAYDDQGNSRSFYFNPNDTFNRMGNPFRSLFGSSNRGYDRY